MSCVNTFAYDLSAFLANVLSPLAGNSHFTVKNSTDFASTIASEEIQEHEIMVSFDVESLTARHLHQFKSRTSWISY